jgi:hypothetical protein
VFFSNDTKRMNGWVKASIEGSLAIQLLTLVLNLFAFSVPLTRWDAALKEILALETGVQIIELIFYGWYRSQLFERLGDVAPFRYYDWALTTPVMLFTTAAYYGYLESKQTQHENKEPFSVVQFLRDNINPIVLMLLLNAGMLIVGYLQEIDSLSLLWSSVVGYASLMGSFSVLYRFVAKVPDQQGLFWFMFFVWSLYGVAAMLNPVGKNISYNILDIFAKNFYGLFLGYLIVKQRAA